MVPQTEEISSNVDTEMLRFPSWLLTYQDRRLEVDWSSQ